MSMDLDPEGIEAAQTLASFPALDPDAVLAELQAPAAQAAFADAVAAATDATRGARRRRGGGPPKRKASEMAPESPSAPAGPAVPPPAPEEPAAKRSKVGTLVDGVRTAMGTVRSVGGPAAAVVGVATVLNRPTVYGNLARVVAEIIKTGANSAITSTWGDWGTAILDVAKSIGVVGELIAAQTAQGPVVPVSIATAIMAIRAQKAGKTIGQLIQSDASEVQSAIGRITKAQVDGFKAAVSAEGRSMNIATLKDIAARTRSSKPEGPGAADLSAAFQSLGAPAMGSTGLAPGRAVPAPGTALQDLASAPASAVADASEARAAAAGLMALTTLSTAPPEGGRRRRRRTKRKVPKRRRATRKLLTFVY
jgi:hypothetical protein